MPCPCPNNSHHFLPTGHHWNLKQQQHPQKIHPSNHVSCPSYHEINQPPPKHHHPPSSINETLCHYYHPMGVTVAIAMINRSNDIDEEVSIAKKHPAAVGVYGVIRIRTIALAWGLWGLFIPPTITTMPTIITLMKRRMIVPTSTACCGVTVHQSMER